VWYQRALDIAFKIDAQNHIFSIFNSIANVFTQTKDFQNALRYIQFGKEMIEKGYRLEPIALARFLANAGIAYRRTGELEVAERLYLESIEISRLNNFQQLIAQNHANLGNLYKDKGDYESALMSYNISLEISQDINQLVGMVLNYINIGSAHRLMGIYEESRLALLKAEELLLKTSLSGFKRSLYSEFVLLGKETSNDAMRIKYERLFDEIDQEINSLDRQNDLLRNQQALYLQVIEREIAIQKARFRVTQLIHRMLIAVILFILASALAYNLFLRRKYRSLFNLYMDNLQAAERGGTPVMAVKEAKPFRTIRNKIVSTFNFSREKNEIISDTRGKTSHYFGHRGAGSESEDMLSATNDRDKERFEMMFEQILYLFKEEKIYIDTSLTLDSLSTKLGTNKKYVSTCINQKTALNFNKFVNSYRVEHVVRLMMNNTQGNLKLTQLYKMSGFRSKVTFYRTFKQFTGLTPVEFALQLRRNLPD
jgi:AraC-like DNA-binding protein/tetratricopeptide (TPR) repeat protein